MRVTRYQQIADDLRRRLGDNAMAPGSILPSEAGLSAEYGASRVTVRRALDLLRNEGLVESRQGLGWIMASEPLSQDLSRLSTIETQLAQAGVRSRRRVVAFGFVDAPRRVREILGESYVLEVRRLHLADDRPLARVTVWCPEQIGSELSRDDVERASFLEQVPVTLSGATQTIGAATASPSDADLLGVPQGSSTLVVERVTRDQDLEPVLLSEHVFPAHMMRFSIDVPAISDVLGPTGMRLVDESAIGPT